MQMQPNEVKKSNTKRTVIIIVVIALVVIGGIIFAVTRSSDIKVPSHSDFQRMHQQ